MCFAYDARPPELPADFAPVAGAAAAERLELTSADGTRFSAALAPAAEPSEPAVVVLPDVRGLYPFYVELAERFADAGHNAVAIDYFGRTAGVAPRGEDFDFMAHVQETRPNTIQVDVAAAKAALLERTGAREVVTVGFCFGGSQSFLAAANPDLGLAGAVGFYGGLTPRPNRPSPIDHAAEVRCPLLGLFGGADQSISPDQVDAFERGLATAGVEHEIVTYEGAPHSFFDRSFEQHAEACDDAWRRVLGFLEKLKARTAA